MKLYIDTGNSKEVVVKVNGKTYKKELGRSQELLSLIDAALRKSHKRLDDVTEIRINRGPGSFTGLRVGVSVANALGWLLGKPVNGKVIGTEGLEGLDGGGLGGVIEPEY